MKKLMMLLVFAGAFSTQGMAQSDDLYFVPERMPKSVETASSNDKPAYYRGADCGVDEYNRAGKFRSYYQKIGNDSLGNDIIVMRNGKGVYPDTSYVDTMYVYSDAPQFDDDYFYTRRMSRWDDFYDPWLYGYGAWRYGWYNRWYDPWYYGYRGWYDPWYMGYYGGWYDPWYYGYAGWYSPYYMNWYGRPWGWYGGGYARVREGNPSGLTGDRTWSFENRGPATGYGRFGRGYSYKNGASTSTYTNRSARNRSFGRRTNSTWPNTMNSRSNRSFDQSRSVTPSYGSGSRGFGGTSGGSFGGARSGGGGFGGGHAPSTGGGHFGRGR